MGFEWEGTVDAGHMAGRLLLSGVTEVAAKLDGDDTHDVQGAAIWITA